MSVASLLFLGVVCAASLVRVIHCQDACEKITPDDLGRSEMLQNTGLVAATLTPTGDGGILVDVRILNMNIVCEAQHEMQDRYRYTSVVVSFNCLTTDARVPECNDSSVVLTEQFDFGCVSGAWSRNILTVTTAARSANPTATLSTGLDSGCILCINPSNPEAAFLSSPVDSVTHCVGEFLDPDHVIQIENISQFQNAPTVLWVFSAAIINKQLLMKSAATTSTRVLV